MSKVKKLFSAISSVASRFSETVYGLPAQKEIVEARKLIAFSVLGYDYLIPLNEVNEILELPESTKLPRVKPWVTGLANVRGRLLPIIDLAAFLGGSLSSAVRDQRVLVLDINNVYVGVIVEEADDIVSHIEELIMAWRSSPKEAELPDRLKRDLHTLKGGARMAGFNGLGDRAHVIESLVDDTKVYDKRFFKTIISHQEKLDGAYDIVRQIAHGGDIIALRKQLLDFEQGGVVDTKGAEQSSAKVDKAPKDSFNKKGKQEEKSDSAADFIKSLTIPKADESSPSIQPSQNVSGTKQQQIFDRSAIQGEIKEVVRIGAEVLDTLVNLSGENIIFRGRVEEQLSEFTQFLDEMDATVDRLQGQVRRLGTETEAQIDYRREQIEASGEGIILIPWKWIATHTCSSSLDR